MHDRLVGALELRWIAGEHGVDDGLVDTRSERQRHVRPQLELGLPVSAHGADRELGEAPVERRREPQRGAQRAAVATDGGSVDEGVEGADQATVVTDELEPTRGT